MKNWLSGPTVIKQLRISCIVFFSVAESKTQVIILYLVSGYLSEPLISFVIEMNLMVFLLLFVQIAPS